MSPRQHSPLSRGVTCPTISFTPRMHLLVTSSTATISEGNPYTVEKPEIAAMGRGKKAKKADDPQRLQQREEKRMSRKLARQQRISALRAMPAMKDPHYLAPLPPPANFDQEKYHARIETLRSSLFARLDGFVFRPVDFLTRGEMENFAGSLGTLRPRAMKKVVKTVESALARIFNLMLEGKDRLAGGENGVLEFLAGIRLVYHNELLSGGWLGEMFKAPAIAALKVEVLFKVVKACVFARHNFLGRKDAGDAIPSAAQTPEYHKLPHISGSDAQTVLPGRIEEETGILRVYGVAGDMEGEDIIGDSATESRDGDDDDDEDDDDDDAVIFTLDKDPSEQEQSMQRPVRYRPRFKGGKSSRKGSGTKGYRRKPSGRKIEPKATEIMALDAAVDEWIRVSEEKGCDG